MKLEVKNCIWEIFGKVNWENLLIIWWRGVGNKVDIWILYYMFMWMILFKEIVKWGGDVVDVFLGRRWCDKLGLVKS